MKKIRNFIEKLRTNLKGLAFKNIIALIVGAIFALLIVNVLLIPRNTENNLILNINDDQTITDENGLVVSSYEYSDNKETGGAGNMVTIYVEDLSTISAAEIRALKKTVLDKKGFKEENTTISIEQMDDSNDTGFDYTRSTTFDPTRPSTIKGKTREELGIKFDTEPIEGLTFSEFVDTNPSTESYDIERRSANSYIVILRNGYTEARFRSEVMGELSGTDPAQIEFIDIFKYKEQP